MMIGNYAFLNVSFKLDLVESSLDQSLLWLLGYYMQEN